MKVLQLILQVEVADDGVTIAKSMLAIEVPKIVVDSVTGIMVGFAVEEIDSAGESPEIVGGDSFPAGVTLRDVPTPYGALAQPTDAELRQTREDHPIACSHGVNLEEHCPACANLPENRLELVEDSQEGTVEDGNG